MKKKIQQKITESDLAEKIIKYLENDNWISYKEVSLSGMGGSVRSDCYFIKKENDNIIETLSIETKLNFSLVVIEQAYQWLMYSNRCYICVPSPKSSTRNTYLFGLKICKMMNIGVFEVNMKTNIIKEVYTPQINLNTKIPPLYEQQRDSIAGNNKGEFITSFKITSINIDNFMKDIEKIEFKILISSIKHHYSNDKSAISSLRKYIESGIIEGYEIKKEGRKITLLKK